MNILIFVILCTIQLCNCTEDKWSYEVKEILTQSHNLSREKFIETLRIDKMIDKELAVKLQSADHNNVYTSYSYYIFKKNDVIYCIVDMNKSERVKNKDGQEVHVFFGNKELLKKVGDTWESIGSMHYD